MAEQFSGFRPIMKPPERRNMMYGSKQLNLPLLPHWKISDSRRTKKAIAEKEKVKAIS